MKTIGERIKEKRKELNLTQLQLANLLNVSSSVINRLEKNESVLDFSLLVNISEILKVSLDYLIAGRETNFINLENMDVKKRIHYICQKDDIELFTKYFTLNDSILLDENFKRKCWNKKKNKNLDETIKREIISNKSYKIFNALLDEFLKLQTADDFSRQLNLKSFYYPAYFLSDNLDEIIKMCAHLGRIDVLEVLKVKWFNISNNKKEKMNIFEKINKDCFISNDTLDYILDDTIVPSKVVEYFTKFEYMKKDVFPHGEQCDNQFRHKYPQLIDTVMNNFYLNKRFEYLNKLINDLYDNLRKSIIEFKKKIAEFRNDKFYEVTFIECMCTYRNTYNYGNSCIVFAYVPDIKTTFESAKKNVDKEWIIKFNAYRKKMENSFGVKNRSYMSNFEIEQYCTIHD